MKKPLEYAVIVLGMCLAILALVWAVSDTFAALHGQQDDPGTTGIQITRLMGTSLRSLVLGLLAVGGFFLGRYLLKDTLAAKEPEKRENSRKAN